jgi:hypothetical protein
MDAATAIVQLAASNSDRTVDVLKWGGLAVVLIIVGIIAIAIIRKKLLGEDSGFNLEGNFSLSDLRQLLADGDITQEEFDRAKQIVLERSREMLREAEADSDKD